MSRLFQLAQKATCRWVFYPFIQSVVSLSLELFAGSSRYVFFSEHEIKDIAGSLPFIWINLNQWAGVAAFKPLSSGLTKIWVKMSSYNVTGADCNKWRSFALLQKSLRNHRFYVGNRSPIR